MDLGGVISRAGVGSAAYGAAQDAQIARQEALERLRQFRLQTKQTQIDMDAAAAEAARRRNLEQAVAAAVQLPSLYRTPTDVPQSEMVLPPAAAPAPAAAPVTAAAPTTAPATATAAAGLRAGPPMPQEVVTFRPGYEIPAEPTSGDLVRARRQAEQTQQTLEELYPPQQEPPIRNPATMGMFFPYGLGRWPDSIMEELRAEALATTPVTRNRVSTFAPATAPAATTPATTPAAPATTPAIAPGATAPAAPVGLTPPGPSQSQATPRPEEVGAAIMATPAATSLARLEQRPDLGQEITYIEEQFNMTARLAQAYAANGETEAFLAIVPSLFEIRMLHDQGVALLGLADLLRGDPRVIENFLTRFNGVPIDINPIGTDNMWNGYYQVTENGVVTQPQIDAESLVTLFRTQFDPAFEQQQREAAAAAEQAAAELYAEWTMEYVRGSVEAQLNSQQGEIDMSIAELEASYRAGEVEVTPTPEGTLVTTRAGSVSRIEPYTVEVPTGRRGLFGGVLTEERENVRLVPVS